MVTERIWKGYNYQKLFYEIKPSYCLKKEKKKKKPTVQLSTVSSHGIVENQSPRIFHNGSVSLSI
jgi:hypothetical protein